MARPWSLYGLFMSLSTWAGTASAATAPDSFQFQQIEENVTMTKSAARRRWHQSRFFARMAVLLAAGLLGLLSKPCRADEGPKPDPAGIATGDKTTAVDAGGNTFTVPAPTDKSSPDYPKNKKRSEEHTSELQS